MNKLKHNRLLSFVVISIVYVLATICAIKVYNSLNYSWWISLLLADVVATIFTFIFSLIFANASVYDPYWSVQPPVILIAFAFINKLNLFSIILLIVVCFWAIRLTANWAYGFLNLNHQDWRYTMLNQKTGSFYPIINFVGIHMVPTLIVYACTLPAVYAILNNLSVTPLSIVCLCISLGAATMQGIADIQMHKFRKHRDGKFIRNGLWKYSRHPNYLGEILMWWGVGLAVVFAKLDAWFLIFGAISNTLLFLFVSIPMADGRQSKKQGFDQYKSQTRMLLPIKKFH